MARLKLLLLGLVFLLIAAGPGLSQTVSIVSGQGQITCNLRCNGFEPLVVAVKDAAGAPVAFAPVTWTVTQSSSGSGILTGGVQTLTTYTDVNGQATIGFSEGVALGTPWVPYFQSTITATSSSGSSVTFYETTALLDSQGNVILSATLGRPQIGTVLGGQAGQTLPGAVVVGGTAPNVAVRLIPVEGASAATAKCATAPGQPDGVVLTDATGTATCDVQLGPTTGFGQFRILVGDEFSFGPFHLEVTTGPPCMLRVLGGNNQVGNAGQALPAPLLAQVADCGGNALQGVPVTWTVSRGSEIGRAHV